MRAYFEKEQGGDAWKSELGTEPTLEKYLDNLMRWVKEAWRVLKPSGSFILNLGGCYCGGGFKDKCTNALDPTKYECPKQEIPKGKIYKTKQFLDVGAFAYQRIITETDFVCRNRGVWCKPNVPSPIRSRLKQSTESIDWFVKNADEYYFNPKLWLKKVTDSTNKRAESVTSTGGEFARQEIHSKSSLLIGGRNQKHLINSETIEHSWRVVPVGEKQKGFELNGKLKQEHVAPFPEALVKPWIESLTPDKVCVKCGKPVMIKRKLTKNTPSKGGTLGLIGGNRVRERIGRDCDYYIPAEYETIEQPSCSCGTAFVAGTVLDPFLGSGTVLKIARDLRLNGIGIELNEKYVRYAQSRINWGCAVDGNDYELKVV